MRLIIFEGTTEEFNRIQGLSQLLSQAEQAAVQVDYSDGATNEREVSFGTNRRGLKPEIALRFLRQVKPEARKALLYIAANGPEVSFAEVAEHLGVSGAQLGGTLTSLTFQSTKLGITIGLERDYRSRAYRIDSESAAAILKAAEKLDTRR